ncbi:hypothetical protein SAMN05192574_101770 [Mucilaginibacter gossypiicola]|uniref:Uncharacterized protein n=1 Tax=Mucilaginibacter gossypiicola TaxID=551995 RepID=A0A1H8B5L7_9SPHI|nr:hypothetical protein SAMN05192574_101770 [Mucilaginibacter gossypiicola]
MKTTAKTTVLLKSFDLQLLALLKSDLQQVKAVKKAA